ncbi:MAG: hypothetical protein WCX46_03540 [Candidatus Paceibacterota bacterium]
MKKIILTFTTLTILSFVFLGLFGVYNVAKEREVNFYHRFMKTDDRGINHFNIWGLFSTTQGEYQSIVKDTMNFSCRVNYPLAPKFHVNGILVEDSLEEKYIAGEIMRIINDSIAKHLIQNNLDYDGTSVDVRRHANPDNLNLEKPKVFLSLCGYSSPEAGNYGFKESIQPGHLEPENESLARERVERTGDILSTKGVVVKEKKFSELQFPDTISANLALKNKSILDAMRYVSADVTIVTERLKIETITVPNLLPIWFMFLFFLFLFLISLSIPKLLRSVVFSINWAKIRDFLKSLFWILIYLGVGFLIVALFLTFPWVFFIILMIMVGLLALFFVWWLIYIIVKNRKDIGFWIFVFFANIFLFILLIIEQIYLLIKKIVKSIKNLYKIVRAKWINFTYWWRSLTQCKRTALVLFVYSVLATIAIIILIMIIIF